MNRIYFCPRSQQRIHAELLDPSTSVGQNKVWDLQSWAGSLLHPLLLRPSGVWVLAWSSSILRGDNNTSWYCCWDLGRPSYTSIGTCHTGCLWLVIQYILFLCSSLNWLNISHHSSLIPFVTHLCVSLSIQGWDLRPTDVYFFLVWWSYPVRISFRESVNVHSNASGNVVIYMEWPTLPFFYSSRAHSHPREIHLRA